MSPFALALMVIVAGAATALQPPTNALLVKPMGSPVGAALVSFAVGTAVLAAAYALGPARPALAAARGLPAHALLGGVYGALFVAVAAYSAPRLGVGVTLTTLVAGQLLAAMLIDHFGLFGIVPRSLGWQRGLGFALVVAGVLLVRRA